MVAWEDPHNKELFALNQDHEESMEHKMIHLEKRMTRLMENIGMDEAENHIKPENTVKGKIDQIWEAMKPKKEKRTGGEHECVPEKRGL